MKFAIEGIGGVKSVQVNWVIFRENGPGTGDDTYEFGSSLEQLPKGNNELHFSVEATDKLGFDKVYVWMTYPESNKENVGVRLEDFETSIPTPTDDQLLNFTVQIEDFDGDTESASFKVGIDGTGINDDDAVSGL